MKARIAVSRGSYGFGHEWTLEIDTPKKVHYFYLGQDVKFCSRVLGMSPRDVVEQIGTGEIDNGTVGNRKLAKFICAQLEVNGRNAGTFEPWAFCAQ